jgi:hypothetical protein
MAQARIEQEFSCSEETFWGKVFFDPEYNRRLFFEELGFPGYRVLEYEETPERILRVQEISPKVSGVPRPIAALIGEGFSYLERGVFTRATHRFEIHVTPSKLSSKIQFDGVYYTEPTGPHRCRRVFDCTVVCKILGVGGLLEKQILGDTERDYARSAVFTNRWVAELGLE